MIGARKNLLLFATNLRISWIIRESVFKGRCFPCSSIVPKGNTIVFVFPRYFLNSFIVMFSNKYISHSERDKAPYMDAKYKTKEQLINELKKTRQRIAEIEASETKRKDIEEKLRESEEKYRRQFEEALDAIFIADAGTGIIIDCNRAASKLVEREKSELIGKHQRILHPPGEFKGEFSKTFKQHIKEKEGQILEAQVITKKGEIKNVAIKANSFELKGKKLLQGIFRDITERKLAEKLMQESEKKYRDLYDNAPDMYHSLDKDGIIINCNETEAKMLGYKKEEITGRPA